MTYDEVAGVFLRAPAEPVATPVLPTSPARRIRDALEPIATQGWWSRPPNERLAALGLGFFDGYVWGRAAALGQPAAAVVVATFGVFEPALLTAVYEQGRATAARDDVLAARAEGAALAVAAVVDEPEAEALGGPLLAALERLDSMGRPLFGGLRELPVPGTAAGRLWRAAELVREHRGDGHLAALTAAGLDAAGANVLTELWLGYPLGEYSATRGFGPQPQADAVALLEARGWVAAGRLTDDGRAARSRLEDDTDRAQEALVRALGTSLDDLVAAAASVSGRILDAAAFPPDPRKRAAG